MFVLYRNTRLQCDELGLLDACHDYFIHTISNIDTGSNILACRGYEETCILIRKSTSKILFSADKITNRCSAYKIKKKSIKKSQFCLFVYLNEIAILFICLFVN